MFAWWPPEDGPSPRGGHHANRHVNRKQKTLQPGNENTRQTHTNTKQRERDMHATHTDASCKSGARRPLQLHRHGVFIHRARLMQRRTSAGSWSQGNLHAWRNTPYFIICVLSHFDVRQCCWADAAWEEPIFQILRHIGNIIMAGLNGLDTFFLNRKPD